MARWVRELPLSHGLPTATMSAYIPRLLHYTRLFQRYLNTGATFNSAGRPHPGDHHLPRIPHSITTPPRCINTPHCDGIRFSLPTYTPFPGNAPPSIFLALPAVHHTALACLPLPTLPYLPIAPPLTAPRLFASYLHAPNRHLPLYRRYNGAAFHHLPPPLITGTTTTRDYLLPAAGTTAPQLTDLPSLLRDVTPTLPHATHTHYTPTRLSFASRVPAGIRDAQHARVCARLRFPWNKRHTTRLS